MNNDQEESQQKSYVRLTYDGQMKYKEIEIESIKRFGFWLFVGNLAGFAVSSAIPYIPQTKEMHKLKVKKYQRYAFFGFLCTFGYHGYKLSKRDFIRSKKKLLANPDYILQEPQDFSDKE